MMYVTSGRLCPSSMMLRTLNGCLLRTGSVSSGIDYWYEPAIVAVSKEKVPAIEVIGGFDTRIALDLDL